MDKNVNELLPQERGPLWHYLLVALIAIVVVCWRLDGTTMDDHECLLALSARAMADPNPNPWMFDGGKQYKVPPQTTFNQWMVPVENGQPRLVKTPLPYWLAAATGRTYAALGGKGPMINDMTARIPSALAAVLVVCITLAIGRRMFSPRAALLGAVMLATSLCLQKWGRNARPEILLTMFMTAAMGCFYMGMEASTRRGRAVWMIAFWIVMGLANLAKEFVPLLLAWPLLAYLCWRQASDDDNEEIGQTQPGKTAPPQSVQGIWAWIRAERLRMFVGMTLAGVTVYMLVTAFLHVKSAAIPYAIIAMAFGVPAAWYFITSRGWRAVARLLPTALPGALLMIAMFAPWMWYMTHLFPGLAAETFAHQTSERAAGTGGWDVSSPGTYLSAIVSFTLPWVIFLPGAWAAAFMKRFAANRRGLVFLMLWAIGLVLLFTSAAGKREHYLLPMIPALCLLMGFMAEDTLFLHRLITRKMAQMIVCGYAVVGVIAVGVIGGLWYLAERARELSPEALISKKMTWARFLFELHSVHDLWPVMICATSVAAVLLVLAGVLAIRGRVAPFVWLAAIGMTIIYASNWTFANRWDERAKIATFAQKAASIVKDDQVYNWSDPQSKTVFYFGRYLQALQWPFLNAHYNEKVFDANHKRKKYDINTDPEYHAWLDNPTNAPWVMISVNLVPDPTRTYAKDKQNLNDLGYDEYLHEFITQGTPADFALFQRVSGRRVPRTTAPATLIDEPSSPGDGE